MGDSVPNPPKTCILGNCPDFTSFTYFFLYFQIFEIKLDKICSKINLRGGPTLNLVQILLEDRDREYFSEKEI